jgi:hypothetical protein
VILWRYGALGLVVVGLAMMGFGASGAAGVAISLVLLPLGFASMIAGVVLPRIEGKFTAGSGGVSAELLAVHKLDSGTFTASAPALAPADLYVFDGDMAASVEDGRRTAEPVKLGDVWDALEQAGFRVTQGAHGKRVLVGPHERSIMLHDREILGWAMASRDLLAQLASWGVQPFASGKYPVPPGVDPSRALRQPYSGVPIPLGR